MPAPNCPCPFREFRDNHLFDVKAVKSNGSRHHVHNGIKRSHFMKMDFVKGQAMGFRFRFADNPKYFAGQLFCCFRHITGIDHRKNFRKHFKSVFTKSIPCLHYIYYYIGKPQ